MRFDSLRLISAAALALAAVAAQAQTTTVPNPAIGQPTKSPAFADSRFLKNASEANHAEIEASKLALAKSSSADVKAFAQQMIDDHTKAQNELQDLANGINVIVSGKPSLTQQAEIKLLSERKGSGFDQHYAQSIGIAAHQDAVKLFQKEADKGVDPDVKAWAAKMLPALKHHLDMAQGLKTKTDAEPKQ